MSNPPPNSPRRAYPQTPQGGLTPNSRLRGLKGNKFEFK